MGGGAWRIFYRNRRAAVASPAVDPSILNGPFPTDISTTLLNVGSQDLTLFLILSWEREPGYVHSRRLADNRDLSDGEGTHTSGDSHLPRPT